MSNQYSKALKSAKSGVILYFAVSALCLTATLVAQFLKLGFAETLCNFTGLVSIVIPVSVFMFHKTLTENEDKKTKLKLFPLSLVPISVFLLVKSIVSPLLDNHMVSVLLEGKTVNPDHAASLIGSLAGAVVGVAVSLIVSDRLCIKYLDFFYENKTLVFNKEYKLTKKWWFPIVAAIIVGSAFALLQSGVMFVVKSEPANGILKSILEAVEKASGFAVTFGFLNIAFKAIDKKTRVLFYPFVFLDSALSGFLSGVFSPVGTTVLKTFPTTFDNPSETIVAMLPSFGYYLVTFVIELALYIIIAKKLLGAFEAEEPQN